MVDFVCVFIVGESLLPLVFLFFLFFCFLVFLFFGFSCFVFVVSGGVVGVVGSGWCGWLRVVWLAPGTTGVSVWEMRTPYISIQDAAPVRR